MTRIETFFTQLLRLAPCSAASLPSLSGSSRSPPGWSRSTTPPASTTAVASRAAAADRAGVRRPTGPSGRSTRRMPRESPTSRRRRSPAVPDVALRRSQRRRHRDRLGDPDGQRRPHPHQRPRRRRLEHRSTVKFGDGDALAAEGARRRRLDRRRGARGRSAKRRRASRCSSATPMQVKVGDGAIAIGNPYGLDRTVTPASSRALQRQISAPNGFTISDVIQTDAAINPGNSGGPLIDADGRVIGINSQIATGRQQRLGRDRLRRPDQHGQERRLSRSSTSGSVEHAYLGIEGADLNSELAKVLNLGVDKGVLVQKVTPTARPPTRASRPATRTVGIEGAQVKAGGDVITAVDGKQITGMDDLIARRQRQAARRRGHADACSGTARAGRRRSSSATARPRAASLERPGGRGARLHSAEAPRSADRGAGDAPAQRDPLMPRALPRSALVGGRLCARSVCDLCMRRSRSAASRRSRTPRRRSRPAPGRSASTTAPRARGASSPRRPSEIGAALKRRSRSPASSSTRQLDEVVDAAERELADDGAAARRRGPGLLRRGRAADGLQGDQGVPGPQSPADDHAPPRAYRTDFHLFDAYRPGRRGGTGEQLRLGARRRAARGGCRRSSPAGLNARQRRRGDRRRESLGRRRRQRRRGGARESRTTT